MTRADEIRIESEDDGYHLVIETDGGETLDINIHACALEFYATVQREIRPYVLEAESAYADVPSGRLTDRGYENPRAYDRPRMVTNRPVDIEDAIEAGYALDDPKSPGYYERMVD